MRVRITRLLLLGLLVVAVAAGVRLLLGTDGAPPTDGISRAQPTEIEAHAVLVTPEAERLPHKRGALAVTLVEGVIPSAAVEAVVLTDEDCAPDAAGVSLAASTASTWPAARWLCGIPTACTRRRACAQARPCAS